MKNFYDVLEIASDVSQKEIREAYLKMVKKYHPDMNKGNIEYAESKMKEINNAYFTLKNPTLRKEYDELNKIHRNDKEKSHSAFNGNNKEENVKKQEQCVSEEDEQYDGSVFRFIIIVSFIICFLLIFIRNLYIYSLIFFLLFFFFVLSRKKRKKYGTMALGIIICCIFIMQIQGFSNKNSELFDMYKRSENASSENITQNLYTEYFPLYFYINYERKVTLDKSEVFEFIVDGVTLDKLDASGIYKYGTIVSSGKHEIEIRMNNGKRIVKKIAVSYDSNARNSPYIVIAHINHGKARMELSTFVFEQVEKMKEKGKYNQILEEFDYDVIGVGPFDEIIERKGSK